MEKKNMKLTNKQVRSIIVEELHQVLSENAAFFGEHLIIYAMKKKRKN